MPEPKNLYVDKILSKFSIMYSNAAYIWRLVMPEVKVNERSGIYYEYNREDMFRVGDDALSPTGMANEVDWGVGQGNYSVRDRGLGDWLAQEAINAADSPLSPQIDTNNFLNNRLDIAQEKRTVDIVFNAATYPVGNKVTLSGTAQWGESADDPVGDVKAAVAACFIPANTLVFGFEAWDIFRSSTKVLKAVRPHLLLDDTPEGFATEAEVAKLFEVDRVVVGRARMVTSALGQTPTYGRMWGKHMAALYVTPGELGTKVATFGKTFVETRRKTYRDFDGKRGVKGAHYFKVSWNEQPKIVAPDLGYLITDAVP